MIACMLHKKPKSKLKFVTLDTDSNMSTLRMPKVAGHVSPKVAGHVSPKGPFGAKEPLIIALMTCNF